MRKVYISGPMTGVKDLNYPKFNKKEKELLELGCKVFNPASIKGGKDWTWENYMSECIKALPTCDYIYLLEGWETSRGAKVELFIAETLGMPIFPEMSSDTNDN